MSQPDPTPLRTGLRLLAAVAALTVGVIALIVAILLVHSARA